MWSSVHSLEKDKDGRKWDLCHLKRGMITCQANAWIFWQGLMKTLQIISHTSHNLDFFLMFYQNIKLKLELYNGHILTALIWEYSHPNRRKDFFKGLKVGLKADSKALSGTAVDYSLVISSSITQDEFIQVWHLHLEATFWGKKKIPLVGLDVQRKPQW